MITFGVAPALLAWMWGFHLLPPLMSIREFRSKLVQLRSDRQFSFPDGGRQPVGALQHPDQSAALESRAGLARNISSGCRFPRARASLPRWCTSPSGEPVFRAWMAVIWLLHGGGRRLSDGEHLALLQFQGHSIFDSRQPFRLIAAARRAVFVSIWFFSRSVLFVIALIYMFSGVFWRLQWIFAGAAIRRRRRVYKEARSLNETRIKPALHPDRPRRRKLYRVAIVGAASAQGQGSGRSS